MERELLFAWREQKLSLRIIARKLNRSHTTLSRELRRNKRYLNPYIPYLAEKYAKERLHQQRSEAPLKNPIIYEYVRTHLKMKWSPETIAGRLPIDHPGMSINDETIYRYIYRESARDWFFWMYLPHARKRRMKRGGRRVQRRSAIPDAVSIDQRPSTVLDREIVGHWETDTLIGKNSDKTAVSTTIERATRYTILSQLVRRTAEEKRNALVSRLFFFPPELRRTLTTDNGLENSKHKEITQALELPMYFCHPYTSWEKGSVENMNGRIRRFIPKGKSIDMLTKEEIAEIEKSLNNTPRKCLGFHTPDEAMQQAMLQTPRGMLKELVRGYLAQS